jgi:Fe2+ transport system protein B
MRIFGAENRKELTINLPSSIAESHPAYERIEELREYITSRATDQKWAKDNQSRFIKLQVANDLLQSLLSNPNIKTSKLQEIYRQALAAESHVINQRNYPGGQLGKKIIDLRCEKDSNFQKQYQADLLEAQFVNIAQTF